MAFSVSSSDVSGARISGYDEQLTIAPEEVDYPQTPAGRRVETTSGSVIKQTPATDPRIRAWSWSGLPNYTVAPRYIQMIHRLEALVSTTRRTRNLSPWVYLKEDLTDEFRLWHFDSGTASSVAAGTLTDSGKTWTTNALANSVVEIVSGTGAGQRRTVTSNTGTVLSVSPDWTTQPSSAVYNVQWGESTWVRCRVLSVAKKPVSRAGVSFDMVRMEFVVDDPAWNFLG